MPKFRISLKLKAVALMVMLAVFSIAIVGWMSYSLAEKSLTQRVSEQLQIRTVFEKNHLEHDLANLASVINLFANEPMSSGMYANVNQCICSRTSPCASEELARNETRAYLRSFLQYSPSFDTLSVVCPDGTVAVSSDELDEGKSMVYNDAFNHGLTGTYLSQPQYDIRKQESIIQISAPLRTGNGTAAVVVATTSRLGLSDYLSLSDMPASEETYLVSSFHQFVTSPSKLAEGDYRRTISTEATKNCFITGEGGGVYENYRGLMVMGHYSYVEPLHACMISEIEMEEVMKPAVEIRDSIIIFAAVLTLLIIVSGAYIVRGTFKPIDATINAAREYGRGNFEHRVLVMGDDELGDLSASINEMADEIKKSHLEISRHSRELEETVKNRTAELEKSVAKEKNARVAMLNMLEDLNDALAKLKSVDLIKDEFLNNAAHELKTPLIPILGYTELALGGKMGKIDDKERELLVIIERNAKRLKTLIDDVLDISKLESGSMKFDMNKMDLGETVGQCVKDMGPAVKKKGLYLKLDAPEPAFILGDQKRLTQVVVNLINNAMKFTDKGGISVSVSVDKLAGMALVRVADTGIGLKEEDMKHLFEKFFQAETSADRKYAGSGLGLNICRGMIKAHGGEIWAESVYGKGTTFSFRIPLAGMKKKEIKMPEENVST